MSVTSRYTTFIFRKDESGAPLEATTITEGGLLWHCGNNSLFIALSPSGLSDLHASLTEAITNSTFEDSTLKGWDANTGTTFKVTYCEKDEEEFDEDYYCIHLSAYHPDFPPASVRIELTAGLLATDFPQFLAELVHIYNN